MSGVPLHLRIVKTIVYNKNRLILLESGRLYSIWRQSLRRIEVDFKIVDFSRNINVKGIVALLNDKGELYSYSLPYGDARLIRSDVISLASSSNGMHVVNTTQGSVLYHYFYNEYDTQNSSLVVVKIDLGLPHIKDYIECQKFSLLVTVEDELYLICKPRDKTHLEGLFIRQDDVHRCPLHLVKDNSYWEFNVYNVTQLSNVRIMQQGKITRRGNLWSRALVYLEDDQLKFSCGSWGSHFKI